MRLLPARNAAGQPEPSSADAAVAALAAGKLVIVPTDTVYGLAADSGSASAIARLFVAKQRPGEKSVPLLAGSTDQAAAVADLRSDLARRLIARWWPGALTVVATAKIWLPEGALSGSSVAIRVPADDVVRLISAQLGRPLAVTSANRSGDPAATGIHAAVAAVGASAAVALDGGDCPLGVASTIVDVRGPAPLLLRSGSVSQDDLERVAAGSADRPD